MRLFNKKAFREFFLCLSYAYFLACFVRAFMFWNFDWHSLFSFTFGNATIAVLIVCFLYWMFVVYPSSIYNQYTETVRVVFVVWVSYIPLKSQFCDNSGQILFVQFLIFIVIGFFRMENLMSKTDYLLNELY